MAQLIHLPPWYWSGCFQSWAGVPRVTGFSKCLFYLEWQDQWEWSSPMCRACAPSLMPLPLQVHGRARLPPSFPHSGQSSSSAAGAGAGRPRQAGAQSWPRPHGFRTDRVLGKAQPCFYFLSNPKNSLYQFTFPRLSWQGKVPESSFFLKWKPTLHVYLLQKNAAYTVFWEARSLALCKWEKNSRPKSSQNTCWVSVITNGNVPQHASI